MQNDQEGAGRSPIPNLNVRIEVKCETGINGSLFLQVRQVECEDDGSFTAVVDYDQVVAKVTR